MGVPPPPAFEAPKQSLEERVALKLDKEERAREKLQDMRSEQLANTFHRLRALTGCDNADDIIAYREPSPG